MNCKSFGVNQILIGLHRVGINGLKEALHKADESGRTDRQAIVDLLISTLAHDNYIPESQIEDFRAAVWREYLRYKGEDFSEFYSPVEVTVAGIPGEELDRFIELTTSVFADFELMPLVKLEPPHPDGQNFRLVIRDETVVSGLMSRARFKAAVQKSFSDW